MSLLKAEGGMFFYGDFQCPLGFIRIVADNDVLHQISFLDKLPVEQDCFQSNWLIEETQRQFSLYFEKKPYNFDLPLAAKLTAFQLKALNEVRKILHGQTITYSQLAFRLGSTKLSRAVAAANASNPFLLLIPCHRVVGKHNDLTGYAGGLWRKNWLLQHEGVIKTLL